MSPTRNVPQVLVQIDDCLALVAAERGGALWRLAEAGRQLDATVVRLPPGAAVEEYVEPHPSDLDVLLLVIEGTGWLGTGASRRPMGARSVVWLPRVAPRALTAGPDGLVCLIVHQRRPAPTAKGLPSVPVPLPALAGVEGGEGPCLLDRVCPACGRVSIESSARYCSRCGEALPSRAF
ncbi:zinc ribbon domain-containing protein [Streptomyces scopuliridis]|uniref:Zinc ribbon domain-containing protein n=1 Tax=Streptomyces scopuliridis TaxID=452529 RepID=A0ACD4ZDT5_9ACTN|nr:zinc ribbon domain-containing protein [Streptomyces scopuliridis]WSB96430.1 zinc ribbon domain-containing protein [Streptomyces scopuliridis]WSC09866.1 zinc ribbon domain-containing protein [Streptomyces scopuliridis]